MWGWIYPHVILLIFAIIFKASCEETNSLTFVTDDTGPITDRFDERITKMRVTPHKPSKKLSNRTKRSTAEGPTQTIEYNSNLKLSCSVYAIPRAKFTWRNSHGTTVYSTDSATSQPNTYTSYITLSNVVKGDRYTCNAVNSAGSYSVSYNVIVKEPLVVYSAPAETTNVVYQSEGTITCDIRSPVSMRILWYYANEITGANRQIVTSDKYWISTDGTRLQIKRMDLDLVGKYTCTASLINNYNEQKSFSTKVTIGGLTLPRITSDSSKVFDGLEGDMGLRIPCEVVGVNKPVVTWKSKGAAITPNAKYSIEDGALVIMNLTVKDSSSYTCEAKNYVGTVSKTFQVKIEKFLNDLGIKHNVYLLEGETRKLECEAYTSKSQSIRWFIGGEEKKIDKPHTQVVKASVRDEGNYTCRVSDKHGYVHTHTYMVDVGYPPKLYEQIPLNDWRGDIDDILSNCESDAKPPANVEWTFNGKVLTDRDLPDFGIVYKWGHYACKISNVHGSVQTSFDVNSSACLINRNLKDAQYMPLFLTDKSTWPKWETTKHYSVVEQKENITLSCPHRKESSNSFQKFPKQSELKASCYKQDMFVVDGKFYKLSDLQCSNGIQPSIIRKKVKCFTNTSELIRVGYNVAGFLETYEVCFDHAKNMPLYTRMLMTQTDGSLSTVYNWYKYPGIGDGKQDTLFSCKNSLSSCCYGKSQLANARDFDNGPAKYSTFIEHLNAVPSERPCTTITKTTWEDIEDMVRSQLRNYNEFVAWSGTHTLQEKNGAAIPRFLWKVLRFNDDDAIAIVHVNDASPTDKDIKCENICVEDEISWFKASDKYTYCCKLSDFLEAFDFLSTDIGESLDVAIGKMEKST